MSNNDAKYTFYCVIFNNNNNNPTIGILNNFSQAKSLFNSQQFWQNINQMKFFLFSTRHFANDFVPKHQIVSIGIQKLWYLISCMSSMTKGIIIIPSSYPTKYWYPKDIIISKVYINLNSFDTTPLATSTHVCQINK
jgi:hypothetical protein